MEPRGSLSFPCVLPFVAALIFPALSHQFFTSDRFLAERFSDQGTDGRRCVNLGTLALPCFPLVDSVHVHGFQNMRRSAGNVAYSLGLLLGEGWV